MSAGLGQELQKGLLACFQAINRAGGIHGRQVQLVSLNDDYDPATCVRNTQQLLEHGVLAFLCFAGTPTTLAALPFIVEAGIPLIGTYSGSAKLRYPYHREVFNIRASYEAEGVPIAKLLASVSDTPRIALFVQNDSYGQAVEDSITEALRAHKLAPVHVERIERNEPDVKGAVRKAARALASFNPTGLALGTVYEPAGELIPALREETCFPLTASVSFVGTSSLRKKVAQTKAGLGVCEVVPYPLAGERAVTRQYLADMKAAGFDPSYESFEAYIAGLTFAMAADKASANLTPDTLMHALEGKHDLGDLYTEFHPGNHSLGTYTELVSLTEDGRLVH